MLSTSGPSDDRLESKKNQKRKLGKYPAVSSLYSGIYKDGGFTISKRRWMMIRFFLGLTAMIVHHFLYAFLDGRALVGPASEGALKSRILRDQSFATSLGNFLARFVQVGFKIVLSTAFVQVFWLRLRTKTLTLGQIDAVANCHSSIVSPAVFKAMLAAPHVVAVAAFMTGLAAIHIYVPSALTVSPSFSETRECTATSIQSIMDAPYNDAEWPAYRVLMSGSYLPPLNPCEQGIACQYNVTFVAPAFECIDATVAPDLIAAFETTIQGGLTQIWSGTMLYNTTLSSGLEMTIIALDMEQNISRAIHCTTYSALYSVEVSHATRSFANVSDVELLSPLIGSPSTLNNNFAYGYAWDALALLNGSVAAGPSGFMSASDGSLLESASLFAVTPLGGHTLRGNLEDVLASYMENVSVSLLSGDILVNTADSETSILRDVNSTCTFTAATYVYARGRLLFTYGIALYSVTLCFVCGRLAITVNRMEETLIFSRILASSLNEELQRAAPLHKDTHLKLVTDDTTREVFFIPVEEGRKSHSEEDGNDSYELQTRNQAETSNSYESEENGSNQDQKENEHKEFAGLLAKKEHRCEPFEEQMFGPKLQMIVLFCCGISVSLSHHLFYEFLHGRSLTVDPVIKSVPAIFQKQTFVKDVGNVLVMIGTGCFSAAMGVATTQVLWRHLRATASVSIGQVNRAMFIRQTSSPSPFFPIPMLRRFPWMIALAWSSATAIYFTNLFATSALRVSFDSPQSFSCAPMSLRDLNASTYDEANIWPSQRVLLSGSYLSPSNPCGAVQCSYNISFVAPAINCTDVSETEMTPNSSLIWNSNIINQSMTTNISGSSPSPLQISVSAYDATSTSVLSTNCTVYTATYTATAIHDGQSLLQGVTSRPPPSENDTEGFMLQYVRSATNNLLGSIAKEEGSQDVVVDGALAMQFSSFFTVEPGTNNLLLNGNLTNLITSYIQNVSLSLLSGEIFESNDSAPSILSSSESVCTHTVDVYEYVRVRLLATYTTTTLVVALGVFCGFFSIRGNRVGETVDVSRIMNSVLSKELLELKGKESPDLRTHIEVNACGQFVPKASGEQSGPDQAADDIPDDEGEGPL